VGEHHDVSAGWRCANAVQALPTAASTSRLPFAVPRAVRKSAAGSAQLAPPPPMTVTADVPADPAALLFDPVTVLRTASRSKFASPRPSLC
jgi:hypothetical protein